jgi:hypothetical protein
MFRREAATSVHSFINIKKLQSTSKKVFIHRAVTALKQQKSKGKADEKGIAEIVHLMKPITRSPNTTTTTSSSSSSSSSSKQIDSEMINFG